MIKAGDTRLAREAWDKYRHLGGLLVDLRWLGAGELKDQVLHDLWLAVRAAAGHTAAGDGKSFPATRSYDDVQLTAMKRPCEGCGKVYFWTNATATRCAECKE